MRMSSYSEADLRGAIKESRSISQLLKKLGLRPAGGNYKTIKFKIKKFEIDVSHFKGRGWNKGGIQNWVKKPLSEILVENSSYTSTNNLRKRLIDEGIFEKKCNRCKMEVWLDQNIPLELEHINGISSDNRLENLELLCPNCHAFTPTYRGKNVKDRKVIVCKGCGKKLRDYRKSGLCIRCYGDKLEAKRLEKRANIDLEWRHKDREFARKFHVEKKELEEMIEKYSFCEIGRRFGVSDNAIRKRAKRLGISF